MSVSDGDVDMDVNAGALPMASSDDDSSLPMPGSQQGGVLRDWSDARLERVASYTTTTMRLKPDKWSKMMANDTFRVSIPLSSSRTHFIWRLSAVHRAGLAARPQSSSHHDAQPGQRTSAAQLCK